MITEEPNDRLFDEVAAYVKPLDFIRPTQLQVKFKVGYSRANRLIEELIRKGVIKAEAKLMNYEVIKDASDS